jgi:hypothetical protein
VNGATGEIDYLTTGIADELEPMVQALGDWAHRNVDAAVCMEEVDVRILMWNMRRKINTAVLPQKRRSVIEFIFPELPEGECRYWIIGQPGVSADLCKINPGYDVDLYITADGRSLASAWMGHTTLQSEIAQGRVHLEGSQVLIKTLSQWMVGSKYTKEPPAKVA